MQSLPHRTFGTNPQRRGQKITLRLADEDRRGSVQLWRRGCAVDQTHTTPPLSASSSPPPLSAAFPCGVGRSGLDSWWEEIGRAQYRKQKEQIRCCYESLPGRLCRVAVYAVVVLFRDAGGIMWPSPGGVRRTRGRPPVAGTRFSVPFPVGLQQPTFQHRRAVSHPSGPLSSTTKVPLPAKAPSPCQDPFSLSWPCLRGAFGPPSPSHLRSSKQQHAEAEAEAACMPARAAGKRETASS